MSKLSTSQRSAARKRGVEPPDPVPEYLAEVVAHLRYLQQFAMLPPRKKSAEVIAKLDDIIAAVEELREKW